MKILGTLNMLAGIYKITNTKNGKSYIGQAVKLLSRYWKHLSTLRLQKHKNPHLQAAVNIDGIDNFTFEVLEVLPLNKVLLTKREQYWIDYYNTCDNQFGYNMASASDGHLGMKRSEETKRKLSLKRQGITLSEEQKRNIGIGVHIFHQEHPEYINNGIKKAIGIAADLRRGTELSEEHRVAIQLGMKKVIAEKGPDAVKRLQEISKRGSQTRAIEIHELAKKKLNLTTEEEIAYEPIYAQDKSKKEIWNDRKNFVRALERKRKQKK
jgi:group I intron endonuclease